MCTAGSSVPFCARTPDGRLAAMPRYLIVRSFEVGEDQMPPVGRRSRSLTEQEFPEITWEHSHVIVDDEGLVHTYCVYEAPSEHMVREHSKHLGQHTLDELHEIAGDVTPADFPPV
jgi:Nickel responsive protein SCO4226-like